MADWTLPEPLQLVCAGFGGQGVMLLGQVITYAGMKAGKHVSWIPSYGPEMRGGTANCGTMVSETPIASPLVTEPNAGILMNPPSLEKFEPLFVPGAAVIVNSSLITRRISRTDLRVAYVDGTQIATELGNFRAGSFVLLGAFLALYGHIPTAAIHAVMPRVMKAKIIEINLRALQRGAEVVHAAALA